ncbi:MAG: nitroreductase family protein [Spirochaetales bacterium]|nr:nitroreductase family protein [Spirochaetales bacterium]
MLELLYKRRSTRKFKDTKVEKEKINMICKSALLSPSSRDKRPWEFIAIDDKQTIEKLSKCKPHGAAFMKGAPLCIAVVADPEKCDVWIEDASIASIIIQLACESIGLGSCWVQIRKRPTSDSTESEEYVKKVLQIPDNYRVESLIAIGYKDEELEPYTESSLMFEKIHKNLFQKKD